MKRQLRKLSLKVGAAIQPVFVSRRLNEHLLKGARSQALHCQPTMCSIQI